MIETDRLLLRGWTDADVEPYYALSSDPEVMRYLGKLPSREDVATGVANQQKLLADNGFCFWALESKADGAFIGFCGLKPGMAGTPIEGRIELGYRLATRCWGQGIACEAAEASLAWGWSNLDTDRIWAITTADNLRSWSLMERLGMERRRDFDFEMPPLGMASPLKPHVTYSIGRP